MSLSNSIVSGALIGGLLRIAREARSGTSFRSSKKICRKAGIQPAAATVHALRHSFGAHLRMAGVPLPEIADLMGHKDLATTQIYAKVQLARLREAVSRLSPLVPSLKPVTPGVSCGDTARKLLKESGLEAGF